tara:strand:- start:435 stop:683 length:249 start_codon:yes stop_codon:yes gene_type:complete
VVKMNKLLLLLTGAIILGGCITTPVYEKGTFVWVGCHRVEENPSPEGSTAFLLLSKLDKGDKMYLQQVDDNGRANVTVGEPC